MKFSKIFILLLFSFACFYLFQKYSYRIEGDEQYASVIYSFLLLSFLLVGFLSRKISLSLIIKNATIWVFVFLILVAIYSYKQEVENIFIRLYSNIDPSYNLSDEDNTVEIRKNTSGHYYVNAEINGAEVRFLVDTGASMTTLTYDDALRIGVKEQDLRFDRVISTANGSNKAAYYIIKNVIIGNISVKTLKIYIIKDGLTVSLLGMNFLNQVRSFEFDNNTLRIVG